MQMNKQKALFLFKPMLSFLRASLHAVSPVRSKSLLSPLVTLSSVQGNVAHHSAEQTWGRESMYLSGLWRVGWIFIKHYEMHFNTI